ncbi:MAG: segregation/condensation protein A [Bacilli bacterium]
MDYVVTLPQFDGPLDLLLHLIKEQDIDICDLNIEVVTKQYLDYIHKMEQLNLDIASSYLVMAAELIEIKSRILLPNINDNDEILEDPKEELINRLLEYKKYKELTKDFKQLEEQRNEVFTKLPSYSIIDDVNISKIDENLSINDLLEAFQKFLDRREMEKPLVTKITNKEYSVAKRSLEIKNILKNKENAKFEDLFEIVTKEYVVVTFLAILDLVKKQDIYINQDKNFGDIILRLKEVK